MKILIADDDADLRALIRFTLSQGGFEVRAVEDGRAALAAFDADEPDFVLLDINMPGHNGLEVCREIRKHSNVPIMMLTVRDQEEDMVNAIECGADGYVRKPFSPRTLLARVKALARRIDAVESTVLTVGPLTLNTHKQTLRIGSGEPLRLTPLELKAVHLMMVSPGRTVTTERLLMQVWGRQSTRERRTLKQLVYRLRRKLESDGAPPVLVTTPGAGYKLVVD